MSKKCIQFLLCFCLICVVRASGQVQGAGGCPTPKCAPNPVPCAHCTGTWTDDFGYTYNLSSNNNPPAIGTYNVTGTIQEPTQDCSVRWQIASGTITQTGGEQGALARPHST